MTYEEALKIAKSSNPFMQFSNNKEKVEEYASCVVRALEKRVPKNAYKRTDAQIKNGFAKYGCCVCHCSVQKYISLCCPTCGQYLDWSNEL